MRYSITFPTGKVNYVFEPVANLESHYPKDKCIVLTDSNVAGLYAEMLKGYQVITIPAGEENKHSYTVSGIIEKLLELQAHRKTQLVGIGGGVVTDITGYVGSIYMRGINFSFIPTTLLGMVDAAIGGKNGINFGLQKNLLGVIRQPKEILFDTQFLRTLPDEEWSNGFAEVIKYACLFDEALFEGLEQRDVSFYRDNKEALNSIIARCVDWKNQIVTSDEQESGGRKLLNFGHTAGHALENLYGLPHGYAVGLGMLIACMLSEKIAGLDKTVKPRLAKMLGQYQLPVHLSFSVDDVMKVLIMDKKRNAESIDYILLNKPGQGIINELPFDTIKTTLSEFTSASNN